MKWVLWVAALVLGYQAPPSALPWLVAMAFIAWMAGRWPRGLSAPAQVREIQAQVESEVLRGASLEVKAIRSNELIASLQRCNSVEQAAATVLLVLEKSLSASACALYSRSQILSSRGATPELPPPLVSQAWSSRGLQHSGAEAAFATEGGVLWVKLAAAEFQAGQLELLEALAWPTCLGLGLWFRQQQLRAWSECLVQLIAGAQRLLSSHDPRDVSREIESLCKCLPHRLGLVCGTGPRMVLERSWPIQVEPNWESLSARPEGAFFNDRLVPGYCHWVAAELCFAEGPAGLILLANPEQEEFSSEVQPLLRTIAALAASALAQTHLYSDLAIAHRELGESQARLVDSEKMAAVGQLAAGMAHELNTPLAAIVLSLDGACQLLKGQERALNRLETATLGVRQCQGIVNSLLLYCRNEAAEMSRVNLNEVVAETLLLLRGEFQRSQVELQLALSGPAVIWGHPGKLRQLLTNLLINARDAILASDSARREISVSSQSVENQLQIRVSDPGVGMPAEVLSRACEPFFTTKPVGKGTGLGLSVCHEIVQQHGGHLQLQSQPGVGTTVLVQLPLLAG